MKQNIFELTIIVFQFDFETDIRVIFQVCKIYLNKIEIKTTDINADKYSNIIIILLNVCTGFI